MASGGMHLIFIVKFCNREINVGMNESLAIMKMTFKVNVNKNWTFEACEIIKIYRTKHNSYYDIVADVIFWQIKIRLVRETYFLKKLYVISLVMGIPSNVMYKNLNFNMIRFSDTFGKNLMFTGLQFLSHNDE